MLPDWLTPTSATAVAAALTALGALFGILVRSAFDARLLARQLEAQRAMTERQLEAQRNLTERQLESREREVNEQLMEQRRAAALASAEERAQQILHERRALYGQVMATATSLRSSLGALEKNRATWEELGEVDLGSVPRETTQRSFLGEIKTEHPWWAARTRVSGSERDVWGAKNELAELIADLALIAPSEPYRAAVAIARVYAGGTAQHAGAALQELDKAVSDFRTQARIDLGTDPPSD